MIEACSKIISAIRRRQTSRPGRVVVALDGGSGAGKSTLAALLAAEISVAWIPVDDFFAADIPTHRWADFSVEERLRYVFDWQWLRNSAIEPLLAGQSAQWYAFDFEAGLQPDGTYRMQRESIERDPAAVILLDGAYSATPYLSDAVDLTVLVDVPLAERHRRLALREDVDFLEDWHQLWDPVEAYYFSEVRPKTSYDLIVESSNFRP